MLPTAAAGHPVAASFFAAGRGFAGGAASIPKRRPPVPLPDRHYRPRSAGCTVSMRSPDAGGAAATDPMENAQIYLAATVDGAVAPSRRALADGLFAEQGDAG